MGENRHTDATTKWDLARALIEFRTIFGRPKSMSVTTPSVTKAPNNNGFYSSSPPDSWTPVRTASPYLHGNPLEFKAPYVGSSVGEFDQASDKVCDKVYGRRHLVEKFQAVKKPTDRIGDWLRHRKIACGAWA